MNDNALLLKSFLESGNLNTVLLERMLETNGRIASEQGHYDERNELVCRLLASRMSIDEISVILKIRVEDIAIIESNHVAKILDYEKKLKARRKSREQILRKRQL